MSFTLPFLFGPVVWSSVLSDGPLVYWRLSPKVKRGGMSLHNAIGIKCKTGITTENQSADVKNMG